MPQRRRVLVQRGHHVGAVLHPVLRRRRVHQDGVPGTNQIQRAFNVKYPTEYIQRPEKWQANQTAFAAFYEAL